MSAFFAFSGRFPLAPSLVSDLLFVTAMVTANTSRGLPERGCCILHVCDYSSHCYSNANRSWNFPHLYHVLQHYCSLTWGISMELSNLCDDNCLRIASVSKWRTREIELAVFIESQSVSCATWVWPRSIVPDDFTMDLGPQSWPFEWPLVKSACLPIHWPQPDQYKPWNFPY